MVSGMVNWMFHSGMVKMFDISSFSSVLVWFPFSWEVSGWSFSSFLLLSLSTTRKVERPTRRMERTMKMMAVIFHLLGVSGCVIGAEGSDSIFFPLIDYEFSITGFGGKWNIDT